MNIKRILAAVITLVLIFSLIFFFQREKQKESHSDENEKEIIITYYDNEKTETEVEQLPEDEAFSVDKINSIVITSSDVSSGIRQTVNLALDLFNASDLFNSKITTLTGEYREKQPGDIILTEDPDLSDEEYRLAVTGSNIYLYYNPAGRCNGLLYGLQDILKQCSDSGEGTLKTGTTVFSPDTKERTLMLDCARKCWSVKWIKNLISEMSWMGFNTLELHLTEEQGIRANIWRNKQGEAVPDCNGNDFSFICGGTVVSWNKDYHEDINAEYSKDDIIEIIEWAQYCHIEIIPSVDFPGHSRNLIERCEKEAENRFSFKYNGSTYYSSADEKISAEGSNSSTIDISSEFTRNLSYAVLQAYASFFKEYGCDRFDIASDEVSVDDPAWSEFASGNGGSTVFDGYIIYVNSLCDILKSMGYSVRANNDYLFSEKSNIAIDKDLQVCYWKPTDSDFGSAAYLVSEGRTVFNCVESFCYYVLRQSKSGYDARSPQCGWWEFHHSTAERVFCGCGGNCGFSSCLEYGGWNPSKLWGFNSKIKTGVTNDNLGGGYMYIWGDWASWDTEENIFYRQDEFGLIRRMWAASAKMLDWHADDAMSWDEFSEYVSVIEYSPLVKK